MKKAIFFLLMTVLVLSSAWAYDFSAVAPTGQTLYYDITSSTSPYTVSVTYPGSSYPYWSGYTEPTGSLTIPSTVTYSGRTYSVTSIGDGAFSSCSGLTSVTIPNSVTSIGEWAFSSCSGLTSVTIPNSVTSIEDWAFAYCSLRSVTIPNSVTSIEDWAFAYCSLESVTIPNSVTSIGDWAFEGCSDLTSVTIPNSVTSIGGGAFEGCSDLTSVTIPNSVTSIGGGAFYDCGGLASLVVETGNTVYDSRNNCNAIIETATNTLIIGTKNTIIPYSVTSIGGGAFNYCSGLTSVTIPYSVTSIGDYAFEGCSGLTEIICRAETTPSLGSGVFYGVPTNIPVYIPCGSSASYQSRWSYFSNFVESPNYDFSAVASTGQTLYYYITSTNGSNTVEVAPPSCSNYWSGYTGPTGTLTIPSTVAHDGITYSVTAIGNQAFYGCSGLTSVTIPNSVTSIGYGAFGGCSGLTSVTIPNSVASIGNQAFYGCSGLTSVTIPNSVTSIGDYAFSGCSGLTSVTIPNSVTAIGDYAFYDCTSLSHVTFNARSCIIGTQYSRTVGWENISSVTIGDSVQVIPDFLFYGCSGLTSVTIPNSVTSIGNYAFKSCTSLSHVTFNAQNCNDIPSNSNRPFDGCTNVSTVTIGDSVQRIPAYLFSGCTGITEITSKVNVAPQAGTDAFSGVPINIPVYIPCGSSMSYYARWVQFNNFVEHFSFSVQAASDDETMGSAAVTQQPDCTTPNAVVEATPADGYTFDRWSNGATQNPYTLAVTQDTTLTAFFSYCSPIRPQDLPYTEGFESYTTSTTAKTGVEPDCWTRAYDYVTITDANKPQVYYKASYAHSGSYSLMLYNRCIYAMPQFDGDVSTLKLSMYVRQSSATYQLVVGVMSDLSDESSFVPVETISNGSVSTPTFHEFDFSSYSGNGKYIAFKNVLASGYTANYSYNYIDDITLELNADTPVVPDEPVCQIAIADLPYTEGFESYTTSTTAKTGVEPDCWTRAYDYVSITDANKPQVYYKASYAHSGSYSLMLYNRCIYAMPQFEGDVSTLKMSLYVRQPEAKSQLVIGVMSDLADETSFVPVQTISFNGVKTPLFHEVDFSTYSGSGKHIAFKNALASGYSGNYSYNYIDDIILELAPAPQTYVITATANDSDMGYVTGSGEYEAGTQVTLTAVPYTGYQFVRWSDGDVSNPKVFSVSEDATYTAFFEATAMDGTPSIVMVTVDNGRNKVYWNAADDAASYKIYREETTSGNYVQVGTASSSATNWTDATASPAMRAYRYKISYVDGLGVESALSEAHKTMHLTINQGLDSHTWNLIWTEYEGMEYDSYRIFRGTSPDNLSLIDAIPAGGYTTYTDANAGTGSVYYQIDIVRSSSLSKGGDPMPKSNIAKHELGVDEYLVETLGNTITVKGCEHKIVRVFDLTGRLIDSKADAPGIVELNVDCAGAYLVQVGDTPAQKVVVLGR